MRYLFLILVGLSQCSIEKVHAGGGHHNQSTVNNVYQYTTSSNLAAAMAAANISPDWTTQDLQVSASLAGDSDDNLAGMLGVARRFCTDCPLLQATIGRTRLELGNGEHDYQSGLSFGGTWVIK